MKYKEDFKAKYELAAFEISWNTSPHFKRPLKPSKIFNWDEVVKRAEMTEEEQAEKFEEMFLEKEERLKKESNKITEALKALNKRRAERGREDA